MANLITFAMFVVVPLCGIVVLDWVGRKIQEGSDA